MRFSQATFGLFCLLFVSEPAMASCQEVVAPGEVTGGCRIRLVTPSVCEEIDLTPGRAYEFAWTTDGTFCETPFKLYIAGNPVDLETGSNILVWQLSKSVGQISNYGGFFYINAAQLEGLTSTNGIYHWVVESWYGSRPNSQTFRVKK